MSVNRNENKIYNCVRIKKEKPGTPLEEFELKALNPTKALEQLNKRFFLQDDEEWKITRLKGEELKDKEPWRYR